MIKRITEFDSASSHEGQTLGKNQPCPIIDGMSIVFIFLSFLFFFFWRFYLFLKIGEWRGERGEVKHQCVVASHVAPTGDLAHDPGMCPDWESNQWHFRLQARTHSTELHQPGPHCFHFYGGQCGNTFSDFKCIYTDPAILLLGIYPMAVLNTVAQWICSEVCIDSDLF